MRKKILATALVATMVFGQKPPAWRSRSWAGPGS